MTYSSACSPKRGKRRRPPAANNPGDASVIYRSGTITIQGSNSIGIFAGAQANGSAEITTLPGTTIIVSGNNPGDPLDPAITAELDGTAAAGREITVDAASTINMFGSRDSQFQSFQRPNRYSGAEQIATDSAPIFVNYTGPGITTEGGQGIGILALARNGGGPGINSGGVTVTSSGPITTSGAEALGIVADSGTIHNATRRARPWTGREHHGHGRRARSRRKALKRMASGPPRRPAPCRSMHSIMFPPRDSSAPGSTRLAAGFPGPRAVTWRSTLRKAYR